MADAQGGEPQELIDIVFVDEASESRPESLLSKITEVECSHKQFSQEKLTNSVPHSAFENDKLPEQLNWTSKKSSVEALPAPPGSTPFLQASSKSINLTKSNNASVADDRGSFPEEGPSSPGVARRIAKIKLRPTELRPKSRSLDIQCVQSLRSGRQEELAKYRKYKTLLSNVQSEAQNSDAEEAPAEPKSIGCAK